MMQVETASRFLMSVVKDEDCAYSTQKQALNAVAFFFKHVERSVERVSPVIEHKHSSIESVLNGANFPSIPAVVSRRALRRVNLDRLPSSRVSTGPRLGGEC